MSKVLCARAKRMCCCVSMFATAVLSSTAFALPLFTYRFVPSDVTPGPITDPATAAALAAELATLRITMTQGPGLLSFSCTPGPIPCTLNAPVIAITDATFIPNGEYSNGSLDLSGDPFTNGGHFDVFAQGDHLIGDGFAIVTTIQDFDLNMGGSSGFIWAGNLCESFICVTFDGTWVVSEPGTMLLLLVAALGCLGYYWLPRRAILNSARAASSRAT